MVFNAILDPIFSPLLKLNSLLAIFIISFTISLFITLIYKKFTDQSLMKRLKEEIKELQEEMKSLRNKPEKMMEIQKRAMETNMKYMMHSFRPTLVTFIPIIIIFGWLNSHMAYMPLVEGEQFSITTEFVDNTAGTIEMIVSDSKLEMLDSANQTILNDKAEWVLRGKAGEYIIKYRYNSQEFQNRIIITGDSGIRSYEKPVLTYKELGLDKYSRIKEIKVGNEKIRPLQIVPVIKSIPWIGGFGWLGTYILFSLAFSMSLRKLLKVY